MDFARRARGLSDEKKLSVAALSETMPPSAISRWNGSLDYADIRKDMHGLAMPVQEVLIVELHFGRQTAAE